MFLTLKNKEAQIAVIGLGYVGLPLAIEFGKLFRVVGFDVNTHLITLLKEGINPDTELPDASIADSRVHFTTDTDQLKACQFFIVAVPTPVDEHKVPDLSMLRAATATVSSCLKKGDYVIYESTVYPGCTEEICLPILEEMSGLRVNTDFKLGYSPERINPGDELHTLRNVIKIVSGSDKE